jgi:hypothetical protein
MHAALESSGVIAMIWWRRAAPQPHAVTTSVVAHAQLIARAAAILSQSC